jgi:hypothetical protein
LKEFYKRYIKQNLGLINLFGKVTGRLLFLLLTSFFAYKLSVKDFAGFAIFWSTLRMLSFFSANNLYIIYFNQVRESLIHKNSWPKEVSSNVVFTAISFGSISAVISYVIFDNLLFAILTFISLILLILLRNMAEFAKSDNSLFLSIFVEDFLFYFLFFVSGIIAISISNSLIAIIFSLFLSILITTICCLILFKKKFKLKINTYKINIQDLSLENFKLGINYNILRGNEFLSNFGVRYLGQIYFGDTFVSYTHIMYQFYNLFALLTMSVISGFQSKITINNKANFTRLFIKNIYLKIIKTIAPFVIFSILIIGVLSTQILTFVFPKYVEYDALLVKVSYIGFIFLLIQPLVFVFIYNKKITNLKSLNLTQYVVMFFIYLIPLIFVHFNEQNWLLLCMTSFIIIQGVFTMQNFKNIK